GAPAPRLKDLPAEDPAKAYETLVAQYKAGVDEGHLVHGDFSEFNILHHKGELVVIDVAQAVLVEHPMARELLTRDAKNLAGYFRRQGVKTTPEETLKRLMPKPKPKKEDDEEAP
ncbi:MAG: RIO1 family regulatory kinase/ATPase, partial [Candidatus Thermoplasmatota archaeon]